MKESYISYLNHPIYVGDIIKFQTSNMMLIGVIESFEKDKAIVKVNGCQYKTPEELEYIKSKAKRQYKVNPKRCIKCIKKVA